METKKNDNSKKRRGVLVGGSGLIGGGLMHYFKTRTDDIEVLSPNSKKLSLREPEDIRRYFQNYRPDFIINTAIASIDSDAQLAYEVNYQGSISLATQEGAELFIDGERFGMTPIMRPIVLDAGRHTLSLKKQGYFEWSSEVTIEAKKTLPLKITLSRRY